MTVMQKHRVVIQLLCTKGITYNKKVKVLIIPPKGEDQYVPVLPATQARGVCDCSGVGVVHSHCQGPPSPKPISD